MSDAFRMKLFAITLVSIVLAACTGFNSTTSGPSTLMPAAARRNLVPTPTATAPGTQFLVLTCADCGIGTIYFYRGNHPSPALKSMTVENAFAISVDDSEDLYVSGGGNNGYPVVITEEYAQGGSFVYSDNVRNPTQVAALTGASPAFFVADQFHTLDFPSQGVDTSKVLIDSNISNIITTTADAAGNVYVGGATRSGGFEVDLMRPGGKPDKLDLDLPGLPVGLNLDARGNLIVDQRYVGVAVYAPGKPSPIYWFDHGSERYPVAIALGERGERLYVLDNATVYVYKYPEGTQLWTYSVPHGLGCCTAQIAIQPRFPLFDPRRQRADRGRPRYWTD